MSQIRSGHNGDAIRRGSATEECSRWHGRLSGPVSPCPVTDVFGCRCSTAGTIAGAIHSAVGCAVTPSHRMRRRSFRRMSNPYSSRNEIVGTTKRSIEAIPSTWFRRNVLQPCDGGPGCHCIHMRNRPSDFLRRYSRRRTRSHGMVWHRHRTGRVTLYRILIRRGGTPINPKRDGEGASLPPLLLYRDPTSRCALWHSNGSPKRYGSNYCPAALFPLERCWSWLLQMSLLKS